MTMDKDGLFSEVKAKFHIFLDGESGKTSSKAPLSSPSFFERRSAPKINSVIYHLFLGMGILCLALVFGGIFGILARGVTVMIP